MISLTFSVHFLICNIILSVLLGIFLFFKKILRKHISADSQYRIWYVFAAALLLPFLPYAPSGPGQLLAKIRLLFSSETAAAAGTPAGQTAAGTASAQLGMTDLASSFGSTGFQKLSLLFTAVWAAGCCAAAVYFLYHIFRIHRIKKLACQVTAETEPDLYSRYLSCMRELKIRRRVALYASCSISSPVSYGLLWPKIIIPQDMDILLKEDDIRFIFLHELQHFRHKDAVLNYISCLLQIVYWFNPLIRHGFRIMQKDREIVCDRSVIRTVGREQAVSYGHTLIRYAEKLQQNAFLSPLSSLGGEKSVIVQRIKEIAEYRSETPAGKLKSVCVLLLAVILVYTASPFLTAYAAQNAAYDLAGKTVEEIDLASYFQGNEGTFVLYDMTDDSYLIYNEAMSTTRVSPDSTFKIYSGLFALEEGLISPDTSTRSWDGTEYFFDSWNQDQTLTSAVQNSVNWYFQELDAQMGYSALSSYYSRISYGNCDLSGGIDSYWAESSLKISPVEQTELLSDLLQNRWGFRTENIQAVRDAMFIADTPAGRLYGKTGTGSDGSRNTNGWFVGFLETGGHVLCFATNIQDGPDASGSAASEITMNILNDILQ